jgi:hypothetical protein
MLVSFAITWVQLWQMALWRGLQPTLPVLAIMTFNTRLKGSKRGETSSWRLFYINSRAAHADKQQISKTIGNPNYISSEIACNWQRPTPAPAVNRWSAASKILSSSMVMFVLAVCVQSLVFKQNLPAYRTHAYFYSILQIIDTATMRIFVPT